MFSIMCDLKTIKPVVKKTVTVSVKNADYEDLVISWLDRLVYLYEVNNMLFSDFRIAEIKEKDGSMMLKAEIYGEHMDLQRHKLRAGVKAATYHKLEVSKDKESGNWKGRVIFDV